MLCKSQVYCGNECMVKSWSHHQQECNTRAVQQGVTLAVPYMYEDVAPTDALEQLPEDHFTKQSYMVTNFNTDGTVESRILPTVAGVYSEGAAALKGVQPAKGFQEGQRMTFSLKDLTSGKASGVVRADLPYNSVSLNNDHNMHSARMAGQYMKGHLAAFGEGMTLRTQYNAIAWPAPEEVKSAFAPVPLVADHVYELQAGDQTQQFQLASEPQVMDRRMRQSKLGRFYGHLLKVQSAASNTDVALDRTGTFRVNLTDGSVIILQVEMRDGVAYITDAQFMQGYGHQSMPRYNPSPARGLPKAVYQGRLGLAQRLKCDPTRVEDVTALRMALKNRVAAYGDVLDVMRSANTNPECSVIRQTAQKVREYEDHLKQLDAYRENLHRHGAEVAEAQPQINALIGRIMQDQHEFIGAKMKEQTYASKLLKDGTDAAEALAKEAVRRYQDAQEEVRKVDQELANSKARGKDGKTGTKLKEGAKRIALNAKKGAAILKKRSAEATMKDISAALEIAAGSPLVTDEKVREKLREWITWLRESKTRTGLSPEAETDDAEDDNDDQYHHESMRNYSY